MAEGHVIDGSTPALDASPVGAPLPTGTVTFLFTDIEGSTRLLRQGGEAYVLLLEDHQRMLRAAFAAHAGREIHTQGDGFFAAFPTPLGAVLAAADGQRSLARHEWPGGRVVRVRMGLHTGDVVDIGGDYAGLAVHLAARISGVANGGQIVLSATTAELVRGGLPQGAVLQDLGIHRLKDFPEPTHLYRLDVPDVPPVVAPLRSLLPAGGLPAPPTELVGREREVAAVVRRLQDHQVRLLTLTGPGGIGKTRLALEVARVAADAFPGGVVFVPLAAVTDPDLVLPAVADALGAQRETGTSLLESITGAVGEHRRLLVLDNVEQVVEAAPRIAEVLERAPAAVALATSRHLLQVRSEQTHPVGALTPDDAVRLFVRRAASTRPDLTLTDENTATIAALVRRLDGLPLAIELAAARVRLLSPADLLARMGGRLDALGRGPVDLPERQRTLRATMDWSHSLLSPVEQVVFARLAVFAGGWTLAAAEAVCARPGEPDLLETLSELLASSLLVTADDGEGTTRLGMPETVRVYAEERLATSADRSDTERRHRDWMLGVVAARLGVHGRDHRVWFEGFDQERANLRAVVQRALAAGDAATVARVARDAFVPLAHRDAEGEVVSWTDRALSSSTAGHPEVRARLLVVRGLAATIFGDFASARDLLREGRRSLPGDVEHAYDLALAAAADAYLAVAEDPVVATARIEEATARLSAAGDDLGCLYMLVTAGHRALHVGDLAEAEDRYGTGVRVAEQLGDDAMHGRALSLLGLTRLALGDATGAKTAVVDGARVNRRGGQPTSMAYSLDGLAAVALADGRAAVAARALAAASAVRRRAGNPASPAFVPLLADLGTRTREELGDAEVDAASAAADGWTAEGALDSILDAVAGPTVG